MEIIAKIHTCFPTKFGVPRQSGLVPALEGRIVFEPKYRNPDAVRGLETFSRIWLIWGFSQSAREVWSATVRPPRLGGNARVGVFATRSPFRPNPIGLSCVALKNVELDCPGAPVLRVLGADMIDGTPIYDIKPYLPFADSYPDAECGFAGEAQKYALEVIFPPELISLIPESAREALVGILAGDPRPSYQDDPERIYGMPYLNFDVRFKVRGSALTVVEIAPYQAK